MIETVELFVIVRHNARFSGFSIGHPAAAVASWRQFQRARFEMGQRSDTFSDLFRRFKEEERRELTTGVASAGFTVAGFEVEADNFLVDADTAI